MKNKNLGIALIAFFAAISIHTSYAADSISHKYPVAVLVELKTQQSMLGALVKDKKYKELEEVKKDIIGEMTATISDFKDNFDYCPVYFFMDTNVDFILKKQFDGILLGSNLNPAKNIDINSSNKNYVIVYYGYPTAQPNREKVVSDSSKYINNSGEPMGRGLIITNDRMQQINYLYKLDYNGIFIGKKNRKYTYSSKHFNIEYFPTAADFDSKLKDKENRQGEVPRHLFKKNKDE